MNRLHRWYCGSGRRRRELQQGARAAAPDFHDIEVETGARAFRFAARR